MVRVLGCALLLTLLGSCTESLSCTEIGCSNAAGVIIRTESGQWEEGAYALDMTFDAEAYACSFTLPDDLPEIAGEVGMVECEPGLNVYFTPRVTCTEIKNGDAVSLSCTPLEHQFDLEVSVYGTPSELSVKLVRDEDVLVDEAHVLTYQEYYPNGPECGPACKQADVKIDIP